MTIRHIIVDDAADAAQDAKNSLLTEDAISGATFVTNAGILKNTGNVVVGADKMTVLAASGNTDISGTITVDGASTLTGAVGIGSTLGVTGNVAVNTNKFAVAASSGNTAIAGTLDVAGASTLVGATELTGNVTIATDKLTVAAASGNTGIAGTLDVAGASTLVGATELTGDVTVATDKLTVAAASGNTAIAGTLAVTGATTLTGDVTCSADLTVAKSLTINVTAVNASTYTVLVDDCVLLITYTATGVITVTIPTAQAVAGRVLVIVDSGGGANTYNITIATEGAETISGGATAVLNTNDEAVRLISDGTNWFLM